MDFSYLSNLSQQHRPQGFNRKSQFLPSVNKHQTSNQVPSSAVHLYLARKQQEEKQKYEEFQKKKEELLSLRSQNSKNNKKAKLMASRTRDNDFSKIKLTEDEEEAKAKREKELRKKGLCNKVDRMKARIELEERDNQLPRKRKKKSHLSNDEPLNDVNNINVDVSNRTVPLPVKVYQKNEAERMIKYKSKPVPIMDYKNLLQVAAKKQYEPVALPDEDFEEDSDEYEEENETDTNCAKKITIKNPEYHDSFKEDRTIPNRPNTLNKTKIVDKARLNNRLSDVHESRQNKENAHKSCNYSQHSKMSGEPGKNHPNSNQSNTSLAQRHSQTNISDCSALHAKENKTIYNRETRASEISDSSKYHSSRESIVDRRSVNASKQEYVDNAPSREYLKKLKSQQRDGHKNQNSSNHTYSSNLENNSNNSDSLALKKKHEQTFRNNIKIASDRKSNIHHAVAPVIKLNTNCSINDQKAKQYLKKDNEAISNLKNNHSGFKENRKIEVSRSFKIPKKDSSKAKSFEDDTPSYYTDNGSNSFEDVKQSSPSKTASTKVLNSAILKSNKNSSVERLQENSFYSDSKSNKSHNKINGTCEQAIQNKQKRDTPSHQQQIERKYEAQHSNRKLKENISRSKPIEKNSSNRSFKVSNSNEYFTEEGQKRVQHEAVEINPSTKKIKSKSEPSLANEVCQYFTEQFTNDEHVSKERIDNLKYHHKKNYDLSQCENSKMKHSTTIKNHSVQKSCDKKYYKQDKTAVKQPQYFTEHFIADENNTKTNCKYDEKKLLPQKEKQVKQSQYFTEQFAKNENSRLKRNEPNHKNDKNNIAFQKERHVKQPQYFTENFSASENSTLKNGELNYKYDKRTTAPQKQSQYFTENFVINENKTAKSNDSSCKYDKKTAASQKEKQMKQPQYFTEHYVTDKDNMTKSSTSSCKYDRKTAEPQKEKQMKSQSQYFTEHFNSNKNATENSNYNKRTSLFQKEKQTNHTQYFTENFVNNEHKTKSDLNSKYEKKTTLSKKDNEVKNTQYFTEHFTRDKNKVQSVKNSDLAYKHEKNTIVPQTDKSKSKQAQNKNTYNIKENIARKIVNKSTLHHNSNSHYETNNKMHRDDDHSNKSENVRRIPKRPREQSEATVSPPSKICKYENPTNNKMHMSISRKDKSLPNQPKSFNHAKSESKFDMNKRKNDIRKSKEKAADNVHCSKALSNRCQNSEQENSTIHTNTNLKECEKYATKQILQKKPDEKLLNDKISNKEKLLHQNKSSLLKHASPVTGKKIIPASSMAKMMNTKPSQNMLVPETLGAKTKSVKSVENGKPKKLSESSTGVKRTAHEMKLANTLSNMGKVPEKKQAETVSKSLHLQKNSSQRTEKDIHADRRKIHLDDAHRNTKKYALDQDRKMKQDQYDSKNRNRFTRPSPRMFLKRNMDSDEEEDDDDEEDDDMSDFIDDDPIEEDEEDYSRYIREIFGYDKRRYRFEDELDDRDMETSYAQQMKEERRSARIGLLEDLEDMRKEEEEKKKKVKLQKW